MKIPDICVAIRGTMNQSAGQAVMEYQDRITPEVIKRINEGAEAYTVVGREDIERAIGLCEADRMNCTGRA